MKRGRNIRYVCTINKNGIGDPSSKYAYDRDGKQFEADIQHSVDKHKQLYADFKEWLKSKNVTPEEFRQLFRQYYEEFIEEK